MRLTGSAKFQPKNRYRISGNKTENYDLLQDTATDKQISSLPLRFRGVKEAIDSDQKDLSFTHKLKENEDI